MRIADNYTFKLADFPLTLVTPGFANLSAEDQNEAKVKVRGFFKDAKSSLKDSMVDGSSAEFKVCDLIREDWKDMVATFFFPKMGKVITDEKIKSWIENTTIELLEEN